MSAPNGRDLLETLADVTTATITTILLKKGLRNVWIRGAFPLAPNTPEEGRQANRRVDFAALAAAPPRPAR